jgi:hypothetical protein
MNYIKLFKNQNNAIDRCSLKNRACRSAGNKKDIFCIVDGPDNDFAVVDLSTAIELGGGYQIVY